jgi:hypothetical protein
VPAPSAGDKIATALRALRDLLARRLAVFKAKVEKVWQDVTGFFAKIGHLLERYEPCVRNHVVPLGKRLAEGVAAAARDEIATFFAEAAPSLAGFSGEEKRAALGPVWGEVTAGLGQRFVEKRAAGVAQVRGWFKAAGHKDGAAAKLGEQFDAVRAGFDRAAAETFAAQTR